MSSDNAFGQPESAYRDSSGNFPHLVNPPVVLPDSTSKQMVKRSIQLARKKSQLNTPSHVVPQIREEIDQSLNTDVFKGYEQIERLNHGGQGIVFRAMESATRRLVAIKVLRDGLFSTEGQRRRFQLEIELNARINHPNIVTLYQGVTDGDYLYCIMQYIDGIPIDLYVSSNNLDIPTALKLFIKVCSAVQCAHENGVIHRDLKPSNVMVDLEGEPHILDFGLAKDSQFRKPDGERERISLTGQVLGTLPYNSPEQAAGRIEEIDHLSDQYSLAVMIYRTLTRSMPYPTEGPPEDVRNSILFRSPGRLNPLLQSAHLDVEHPADFIRDLETVLSKALSKEKMRRYPTVLALSEDLQRVHDRLPIAARADSRLYQIRRHAQRHRKRILIAVGVCVLLLGAAITTLVMTTRAHQLSRDAQASLLSSSLARLGGRARDEKRTADAINLLKQSAQVGSAGDASDPLIAKGRFDANEQLANIYIEMGQPDQAIPYRDEAVRIANDVVQHDPANPRSQRMLAFSLILRGNEMIQRKNYADALAFHHQATELRRKLCLQLPGEEALRSELARSLGFEAQCLRLLGRLDESRKYYEESHAAFLSLFQAQPDSVDRAIDVIYARTKMAAWYMTPKTAEGNSAATEWLNNAENLLKQIEQSSGAQSRRLDIDSLKNTITQNRQILARRAAKTTTPPRLD